MLMLLAAAALAASPYQQPPDDIAQVLDATFPPSFRVSGDDRWMLQLERPALPPISELSEPRVEVAGLSLNPRTNGPAREYAYVGMVLRKLAPMRTAGPRRIALPEAARVRNVTWSMDDRRFAFTNTVSDGIELWVVDVEDAKPRRLLAARLNAAYGAPCDWLPGDAGLICKVVPESRGALPEAEAVPGGPLIEENLGTKRPGRTWTRLLQSPHDEALFEHMLTSELVHVGLDGSIEPILGPALIDEATPSPDGEHVLVSTLHRPFSYQVPASRFPVSTRVIDLDGGHPVDIEDLPLADAVPITYGSVREGRRGVGWRADAPATLWMVEALDGGDAGREAEHRDQVTLLEAPFHGEPQLLTKTSLRFGGIQWGDDDTAVLEEWWYDSRRVRTMLLAPGDPTRPKRVLFDRSWQDQYADPGDFVMAPGPHGWNVLMRGSAGELMMRGKGVSPTGVRPFLRKLDPVSGELTTLFESREPFMERVVHVLADGRFMTRRESATEPPNYWLHAARGRPARLTDVRDWAPAFADIEKEVITYERDDGLQLSATVHFPPGHDPAKDGPLPMVFWAYPSEFKSRADAAQVAQTALTFDRPYGSSHMFLLLAGYAIVDDPTIPIVGEGDAEPNDTYVEQLVSGAQAAVDAVVSRGWADPSRLVIGGHSYGAFTTANLLAHTDLFAAGIARSGAYNRTLTPFSFQGEQRSFWEAQETYMEMSPFTHAADVNEPLLLIHGMKDSNSGTYPLQSERYYAALKGLGATVRWVQLPNEDHGYRARESVGHVLWEMLRWCETYAGAPEQQ